MAFEDAIQVFDRPYLELADEHPPDDKERFIVFGEVRDQVLAVVYAWRAETRRIISARKATKRERAAYFRTIYSR